MNTAGPADTVERFRAAVAHHLGLHVDSARQQALAEVLDRRLAATGLPAAEYVAWLRRVGASGELVALALELTVPETYFFRNRDQFRALTEVALPARAAARAGERRLSLLSAGCASGEEAYSLAIVAREAVDTSWAVSVLGADVNPAMLEKAARGRYSPWALRETPPERQQRWFVPDGRDFRLVDAARTGVRFEAHNLAHDDATLWQPESYDVVFFRNVLMYFTPEHARAAIARVTGALKPGGYLFLGHAETLRGLSNAFHLRHTHETFYYQLREAPERVPIAPLATSERHLTAIDVAAVVDDSASWIEAIRRASERIESLTEPRRRVATTPATPAGPPPRPWDLALALELLREERFADAIALVRGLPAEAARDPDVLLLAAALYTHGGQLADAEEACARLLEVDELSAGAHYLIALCREGAGDRIRAEHHDQIAVYLDPGFAMPHLHLGLLARRAGDRTTARRELEQAALLLQREESARLILFGGGFGREALVALCRTELRAVERRA
jgi:chemotaxis protein methyltransferase CheR